MVTPSGIDARRSKSRVIYAARECKGGIAVRIIKDGRFGQSSRLNTCCDRLFTYYSSLIKYHHTKDMSFTLSHVQETKLESREKAAHKNASRQPLAGAVFLHSPIYSPAQDRLPLDPIPLTLRLQTLFLHSVSNCCLTPYQ